MKKKIISTLLATSMLAISLVGCGNEVNSNPVSSESTQQTEQSQETPASTPEVEDEQKPLEALILPLVDEPTTITIGVVDMDTIEDHNTCDLTLWIEEQTGIDLEFVLFPNHSEESLQQFTLMASGNEKLPDIIWNLFGWSVDSVYELGDQGFLIDLKELIENYAPNYKAALAKRSQADQDRVNSLAISPIDGGYYAMAHLKYPGEMQGQSTMMINQKWLDAVGMDIPTTIDELYAVMEAFATKDPNGNGKKDEIPMVGMPREVLGWITNAYTYINMNQFNPYWINVDENGKLYSAYTTDAYREALKTIADMTAKGYINTQTYTLEEYPVLKNLTSNPATTECLVGITANPANAFTHGDLRIKEYVPMYELQAELAGGGYYVQDPAGMYWPGSITKDCANPELAMQLMDFMCTDEAIARATFGTPGVDWQFAEGTSFETAKTGDIIVDASILNGRLDDLNRYWGGRTTGILNSYNTTKLNVPSGDEFKDYQQGMRAEFREHMNDITAPDKVITELVYTVDESENVSASKNLLNERFIETRAQFATGILDPNSDADWKAYLDSVESIGLSEFLEISQKAYDRANGK